MTWTVTNISTLTDSPQNKWYETDRYAVMCLDGGDFTSTDQLLPDGGLWLPLLVITSSAGVVSLLALTCKSKRHEVGLGNLYLGSVV